MRKTTVIVPAKALLKVKVAQTNNSGAQQPSSDNQAAFDAVRQEQEIIDQLSWQDRQWFMLRLAMGYAALIVLFAIVGLASGVLLAAPLYPPSVVVSAEGALFVEVIGGVLGVWKIVIVPAGSNRL